MESVIIGNPEDNNIYKDQKYFLILAHELITNKKYQEFVINLKKQGKYLIFDNSVAERREIDNNLFWQLADKYNMDEVILQDILFNWKDTKSLLESQIKNYGDIIIKKNIKTMGVIQAKTLKDVKDSYLYLQNRPGIDIIGVPGRCDELANTYGYNRKVVTSNYMQRFIGRLIITTYISYLIKENNIQNPKPMHILGSNGWLEQVLYNNYLNLPIRSIDSKILSRISKEKYTINNFFKYIITKPKNKFNFNEDDWDIQNLEKIMSFINTLKR